MLLFWPFKLAAKIVSLAISAIVVYLIYCGVQVVIASNASSAPMATEAAPSAIVVLIPDQTSTTPSADLLGRLTEARLLYQAGVAHQLVLLSTTTSAPVQLGSAPLVLNGGLTGARAWLTTHGVPASAISTTGGASTYASFVSLTQQLTNPRVAIVTDAVSAYWVLHAASTAGLVVTHVYPASASKRPVFQEMGSLWRQTTGVAVGRLFGYSRTTWVNS